MADKITLQAQLELIQNKYVGTGHSDVSKYEWGTNQLRDSFASYVGHYPLLSYFAVAQNNSIGRVRYTFLEKMLQPTGPPPPREEE